MFSMVNGLHTDSTPGSAKVWAIRLCLVVISACASLLILEAVTRVFFPQQLIRLEIGVWRPDDAFGYCHVENTDVVVNTGERPVKFMTDELGFRVSEESVEGGQDPRILMLGDSFVAGLNVPFDQTIGAVLDSLLSASGCSVQVENAGVSGWSPNHYLLQAKRAVTLRKYRAVVVCLYAGNDVIDRHVHTFTPKEKSARRVFEWPEDLSWTEVVHALILPANDILETRSHVYVLARRFVKDRVLRSLQPPRGYTSTYDSRTSGSAKWRATAGVCKDIEAVFESMSVPVIFVLLPTQVQLDDGLWEGFLETYALDPRHHSQTLPNLELKKAFDTRGLQLLDPLNALRSIARNHRLFDRVDPHLNPLGNRSVAEFLEGHLEGLLCLPTQPEWADR